MELAGRRRERALLDRILGSGRAEFVAVYGRRRVGKTFLVREHMTSRAGVYFEATGQRDASRELQLHHFRESFERVFGELDEPFESWDRAFAALADAVAGLDHTAVLFLDELPWMATRKSGLLEALDYWWNTRLSRMSHVKLIVCGSAAAWIVSRVINARGGLHNRITNRIHLMPFDVPETGEFLRSRGSAMTLRQVVALYMAVGGVPWYLEQVDPRHSATQAVQALCFEPDAPLRHEFSRLFASLFRDGPVYERIVREIASVRAGLLRTELVRRSDLRSGGGLARRLDELEQAGFIAAITPWDHRKRNIAYRVVDPWIFFHLRWVETAPAGLFERANPDYWLRQRLSPAWHAWAGLAFETLCMQHAQHVKRALGFAEMPAEVGSWRFVPRAGSTEQGAQVDLLFDRADNVITLCELKYTGDEFAVDKSYARELIRKVDVFQRVTRTKKDVQLALVSSQGLRRNVWSEDLVTLDASIDDMFG